LGRLSNYLYIPYYFYNKLNAAAKFDARIFSTKQRTRARTTCDFLYVVFYQSSRVRISIRQEKDLVATCRLQFIAAGKLFFCVPPYHIIWNRSRASDLSIYISIYIYIDNIIHHVVITCIVLLSSESSCAEAYIELSTCRSIDQPNWIDDDDQVHDTSSILMVVAAET
jgi:hypothetical protein